jgi:hypothetical protein
MEILISNTLNFMDIKCIYKLKYSKTCSFIMKSNAQIEEFSQLGIMMCRSRILIIIMDSCFKTLITFYLIGCQA